MAVIYAIYAPSLPFEVRCESGIYVLTHAEILSPLPERPRTDAMFYHVLMCTHAFARED